VKTIVGREIMADAPAEVRFRRLFVEHYPAVLSYARRRVPVDAAEDVAAETFTVAWRRLERIPEHAARPWLYGVARNLVANVQRGERRRLRLVAKLSSLADSPAPAADSAADVLAALGRLGSRDREVLTLAAWEGLSPQQMAVALGCSANAASIRLHRARRRLAKELGTAGHEPTTQERRP
jgi:RNA polymerase sigma-70 factor (ECF subfamily)